MKLVLCRQEGTENGLSSWKGQTSLLLKLTTFVKTYSFHRALVGKIKINKCFSSFYMPKELDVSAFSKVLGYFLSSQKKKSGHSNINHIDFIFLVSIYFQMHTVTLIIHYFRVFRQQLKKTQNNQEVIYGSEILLGKLPLAWLDFSLFWWQVSVYEFQTPIQFYNECPVYSIDAFS